MAEPELLPLRFQRCFLAARQLRSFPWAELERELRTAAGPALLLDILHKTVLHPLCVKYPPATKYRRCFLTELIKKHEYTAAEPLDELYDTLAGLLNEEESTLCYKNYLLPTGEAITLSESTAIVSGGTTGLVTWDAALHLAAWAVENPGVFTDRTVLELGSGIGLTGIAICKACKPKTYIFSDCHPRVLKQLEENIHFNGFLWEPESTCIQTESQGQGAGAVGSQNPRVIVAELDWGSVTANQLLDLQPDVIIAAGHGSALVFPCGKPPPLEHRSWNTRLTRFRIAAMSKADVIYDPEVTSALTGMLQKLSAFRATGTPPEVYIASTIRNPDTYRLFQAGLGQVGIGWQVIPALSNSFFLCEAQPNVTILQLLV